MLKSKFKLENLKTRVDKIQGCIKVIEDSTLAITMKSAALYPDLPKNHDQNFISLFYEDTCDFSLIKHYHFNEGLLNTKPSNSSLVLG